MVELSMQHGMSGEFRVRLLPIGVILGPVFHRYDEGYRFGKLACDLVEKHGFIAVQARVYIVLGRSPVWTQPVATAIDFARGGLSRRERGGRSVLACYGMHISITYLLLRNDPLDVVWRESEMALDFAREARYDDGADIVVSQQRFIAAMQGRTATFSTFSDAQFDEAAFEAQLAAGRNPIR